MSEEVIKISLRGEDQGLAKAFGDATKGADNFGKAMVNVPKRTADASNALTNLSRIAQDAPFGFIGITNNINPMLESFQRLKAETGSTGAALKGMVAGLAGPAGLGLAVGVVSALLTTFGDKIFSSGKKTEDAKKQLESYVSSLDSVSQANLRGAQAAQEQLVSLQTLYAATQNANVPLAERKKLVDELQTQYPKYFKNISDEVILAGGAEAAYKKLSAAILNSARARAAQDSLVESQKQQLALESQLGDAMDAEFKASQEYSRKKAANIKAQTNSQNLLGQDGLAYTLQVADAQGKITDATKKTAEVYKELTKLREKDKSLIDAISQNVTANGADVLVKPGAKVSAPKIDKPKAEKDYSDDLTAIFRKMQLPNLKIALVPEIKDDSKKAIDQYLNGIRRGMESKNDVKLSGLDVPLDKDAILSNYKTVFTQIGKELPKTISVADPITGIFKQVNVADVFNTADLKKGLETAKVEAINGAIELAEGTKAALNGALANFAVAGFEGIGQALGNALTGGGMQDAIAALGASLGGVVESLGKQLIQLGVTGLLAQKAIAAIFKNPFLAIGAGVAFIALGAAIKNLSVPKLAEGGIIPRGFEGDRFPAFLNSGERVVPEGDWKKLMTNGFGGGGSSNIKLRGRDLVLVQNRENRSQRRGG